jgi:hypothetical protein
MAGPKRKGSSELEEIRAVAEIFNDSGLIESGELLDLEETDPEVLAGAILDAFDDNIPEGEEEKAPKEVRDFYKNRVRPGDAEETETEEEEPEKETEEEPEKEIDKDDPEVPASALKLTLQDVHELLRELLEDVPESSSLQCPEYGDYFNGSGKDVAGFVVAFTTYVGDLVKKKIKLPANVLRAYKASGKGQLFIDIKAKPKRKEQGTMEKTAKKAATGTPKRKVVPVKKVKEVKAKAPKAPKAPKAETKNQFGHRLGSDSDKMDKMMAAAGGSSIPEIVKTLKLKRPRVVGHLRHLQTLNGLVLKWDKDSEKVKLSVK